MSPTESPDHQVIDFDRALSRVAGSEEMLRELAEIFLKESPAWLVKLEEAVGEGDAENVFRAAHDLKGSTEVFSAPAATSAAKELEWMGRNEELAEADEALGALKAELVWVRNALTEYLNGQ